MFTKPMNLDGEVHEDCPVHPAAYEEKDCFGVEIELEGLHILTEAMSIRKFWGMHNDGSLRANITGRAGGAGQALEYVSSQPLNRKQTSESLKVLFDFLNKPPVKVFPSYRTSVHVHVNCGREKWRTVYNYITLSIIFDELFSSINGEHRIGNNFCLRFIDAEAPIREMTECMEHSGYISVPDMMRYSSINFASLKKFGTIEFRSMECTTDLERVEAWISTLQRLKEAARDFQNPVDIIGMFSRYTEHEFASKVLGDGYVQYKHIPNLKAMLRRGMRLAQDFAYSSTWEARGPDYKAPRSLTYGEKVALMEKQKAQQLLAQIGHEAQPGAAPAPGWAGAAWDYKPIKAKPAKPAAQFQWNNAVFEPFGNPAQAPQPEVIQAEEVDDDDDHHFEFDDEEDDD